MFIAIVNGKGNPQSGVRTNREDVESWARHQLSTTTASSVHIYEYTLVATMEIDKSIKLVEHKKPSVANIKCEACESETLNIPKSAKPNGHDGFVEDEPRYGESFSNEIGHVEVDKRTTIA